MDDLIRRSDAIRIASGYCHWTNIPAELAKLPSVNPIPCEDAISRQAVLEGLASIAKAKAKSDAQKSMMGKTMFFVEQLPSVSTEKTGHWIKMKAYEKWGCSECYTVFRFTFKEHYYCPSCGAKMEVEEDG